MIGIVFNKAYCTTRISNVSLLGYIIIPLFFEFISSNMTETKARNEKFIELPNDLVDKFNGFSLDFGGYFMSYFHRFSFALLFCVFRIVFLV